VLNASTNFSSRSMPSGGDQEGPGTKGHVLVLPAAQH
jgi:hypothetical protein